MLAWRVFVCIVCGYPSEDTNLYQLRCLKNRYISPVYKSCHALYLLIGVDLQQENIILWTPMPKYDRTVITEVRLN